MLTSGQDSWRLSSIDYPAHISIFGKVFYPPKNKIPLLSWQFIRLNFECTTGKSLLTLYTGKDMGLTFINHQSGYGDVYLEDYQGAYYPATLIGACWLAVPAPINVVEENRFALHFQELQPLDIGFQNPGRLEDYRLAYASNLVEDVEIYTLNPINGLSRRLTYLLGKDYEPAWSPDRLQIAFAGQHGGLADLFTIPAAGGEAVNLTQSPNIEEGGPVFSPDGKALAFHARSSGAWNIYRLELAPQALTRLSQDAGNNQYPCWSPDGSQLAFQSNRNGDWDLSIMNKDGSQATTITGDPANEILPSWSPDGTKIAFWSDRGGQWRLYTIDPAGGDWLSLTYYDNPGASPQEDWRLRPVQDSYEPGSVVKPLVAAAALGRGAVRPGELFDCRQRGVRVAGKWLRDHAAPGMYTLDEIVSESANAGIVQVALRMRREEVYQIFDVFGFGRRTGVGYPGESAGILPALDSWSGLSQASLALGQELTATPLQVALAYAAIANGGWLLQPRLVARATGGAQSVPDREQWRAHVLDASLSERIGSMLEAVVEDGTGAQARVPGYRVAGKTGTAQRAVQGSFDDIHHVAWFAGFLPQPDPSVVVVVAVEEPAGEFWGATVAAPVFARVAKAAMCYLAVAPTEEVEPVEGEAT